MLEHAATCTCVRPHAGCPPRCALFYAWPTPRGSLSPPPASRQRPGPCTLTVLYHLRPKLRQLQSTHAHHARHIVKTAFVVSVSAGTEAAQPLPVTQLQEHANSAVTAVAVRSARPSGTPRACRLRARTASTRRRPPQSQQSAPTVHACCSRHPHAGARSPTSVADPKTKTAPADH